MRDLAAIVVVGVMLLACAAGAGAVNIETVIIGHKGNVADTRYATPGYGGVAHFYNIGTFEVTSGQYAEFLNAVAGEDTHELYNTRMADLSVWWGCNIQRSGASPNYSYSVEVDWADRPVNYVSWGDAARFANWLHNGQPKGAQNLSTTEGGSYYLNGATSDAELMAVVREADADWVIPSEDEWYKAAYYDGVSSVYYEYPMGTDAAPNNGNPEGDTGNSANFVDFDYPIGSPYWRSEIGFFELSESPYITFDQGGNVTEWNEAVIGALRGLRGGSFIHSGYSLLAAARSDDAPTYEYYSIGFRVAEVFKHVPVPTASEWGMVTMTVLVLAAGMLVLTRRRAALVSPGHGREEG